MSAAAEPPAAREPSAKYVALAEPALVRGFELLATAPGGILSLRSLVMQLAVQGKLVAQDPSDVPIREHDLRPETRAGLNRTRPTAHALHNCVPLGWIQARLGDVFTLQYGSSLPAKLRQIGAVPVYGSNGVVGRHDKALVTDPSLVIGRKGSVGAVNVAREPFWPIDTSYFVTPPPYVALEFAYWLFVSLDLGRHDKATAIPGINRNDVYVEAIVLPPLAEQHRIVARVEELMKLCDALEQSGRLADEQHARFTSTLFDALAASESAHALAENWQRVAEHFDLLLDRPEAVDALEQATSQLAVRGLLVPQATGDEPVAALLQRLRAMRLPRQGKTPSQSATPEDPVAPYELPNAWSWAALDDLVENIGSGWSPACDEGERLDPNRWAVLRTTSVQVMDYRPREHKAIPLKLNPRPDIEVRPGDILITRAGPLNRVGISCWVDQTPPRLMLSDKIVRFHPTADEMLPAFIVLAMNAGWTRDQLEAAKTGMAASQVNISQADLRRIVLPVCSKAEQRRIVARVEEVRRLCADLRQCLTQARETQSRLADALVAEVA